MLEFISTPTNTALKIMRTSRATKMWFLVLYIQRAPFRSFSRYKYCWIMGKFMKWVLRTDTQTMYLGPVISGRKSSSTCLCVLTLRVTGGLKYWDSGKVIIRQALPAKSKARGICPRPVRLYCGRTGKVVVCMARLWHGACVGHFHWRSAIFLESPAKCPICRTCHDRDVAGN